MLKLLLPTSMCGLFLLGSGSLLAQLSARDPVVYESHNQIDPRRLKLHSISGTATDDGRALIPAVIIGLFTDLGHKLIATTLTDSKGEFAMAHVSPGKYRLVAKFDGFCPANVPILVESTNLLTSGKSLKLHMRPGGIDTCSFGSLK